MKHELPFYMAATQGFTVDHSDATAFTTKVLKWWANADKSEFPTWALAARMVFAFTLGRVRARLLPPQEYVRRGL